MEWKDSNKTKTGPENSGLVKFLFQCHLFAWYAIQSLFGRRIALLATVVFV
jgi:hypothetical protein